MKKIKQRRAQAKPARVPVNNEVVPALAAQSPEGYPVGNRILIRDATALLKEGSALIQRARLYVFATSR
jgi:hypothetical protein